MLTSSGVANGTGFRRQAPLAQSAGRLLPLGGGGLGGGSGLGVRELVGEGLGLEATTTRVSSGDQFVAKAGAGADQVGGVGLTQLAAEIADHAVERVRIPARDVV
jgi:hypothetical protein